MKTIFVDGKEATIYTVSMDFNSVLIFKTEIPLEHCCKALKADPEHSEQPEVTTKYFRKKWIQKFFEKEKCEIRRCVCVSLSLMANHHHHHSPLKRKNSDPGYKLNYDPKSGCKFARLHQANSESCE